MQPANIATIIVAAISAVVSLGTVAWVSFKSKFQDRQNSSIKITTKKSDGEAFAEIVIDFENDESFSQKATSFQNGNNTGNNAGNNESKDDLMEIPTSPNFNSSPSLKKLGTKVVKKLTDQVFEDDEKSKIKITSKKTNLKSMLNSINEEDSNNLSFIPTENEKNPSFTSNALETNKEGDKLIASNRDNLVKKSLYVYNSVVKTVFSKNENKLHESEFDLKIPNRGQSKLSVQANKFFGSSSYNPSLIMEDNKEEIEFINNDSNSPNKLFKSQPIPKNSALKFGTKTNIIEKSTNNHKKDFVIEIDSSQVGSKVNNFLGSPMPSSVVGDIDSDESVDN